MSDNAARPPLVVITGAAGAIGCALAEALRGEYRVVGMDLDCSACPIDCIEVDLTDPRATQQAFDMLRQRHGECIASVIHLAAYFDFSGEPSPLYQTVNIDGTRHLLACLQQFEVEQLLYTSTMLVHRPCRPGQRIDESTAIEPQWIYPQSKAEVERILADHHGLVPYIVLRLAGLYDEDTAVPTLSRQIARIYQRDLLGHVYAGDPQAGQSMIHRDDLIDAVQRAIARRGELRSGTAILLGEPDPVGYQDLQNAIGTLLHGAEDWATLNLPKPVAKAGAWLQGAAEPLVPDAIDHGEKPFIRPFMIDRASDHYALDLGRAQQLLGWQPRHRLLQSLPAMLARLQDDPAGWYRRNDIPLPGWLEQAATADSDAEALRQRHERDFRRQHQRGLWARFAVFALGSWQLALPTALDYASTGLLLSDLLSGAALMLVGALCLSWRLANLRWLLAAIGLWILFAPLLWATPSAALYANATLVGTLVIGFALAVPPFPGISPVASDDRSDVPPGWEWSPSRWLQRAPIILLAFVGLYISRALAAYQLGHVDAIWDPLFGSAVAGKNGSEAITTSSVSEAWPVSDAGLGALTYALEILTGLIGSAKRWRTMPWVVVLFGIMIVPLGIVSITFIVIQPIVIGTWCTLCLIAAAAMLVQIPYSLDELLATGQFLWRRKRAGHSLLRVFFVGDRDEGARSSGNDDFERRWQTILMDMFSGGVRLPWNLAACIVIGVWLMTTRLTVGSSGGMANADHLIGSLVITFSVIALSEVARPARWLNLPLAAALLITPFAFDASAAATASSIVCAALLALLSLRPGPIQHRWGGWERYIV